jgi:hypothetical protein
LGGNEIRWQSLRQRANGIASQFVSDSENARIGSVCDRRRQISKKLNMRIYLLFILLILASVITGCSGGSDETTTNQAPAVGRGLYGGGSVSARGD